MIARPTFTATVAWQERYKRKLSTLKRAARTPLGTAPRSLSRDAGTALKNLYFTRGRAAVCCKGAWQCSRPL